MHHPLLVKVIRIYFALLSWLSPSLAVYSAHKLFHYPINSKRKNAKEKKVPPPHKFTIYLDKSTQLQAYQWGDKKHPTVLLVHGWSTTVRSMSNFLEILLKSKYQVISYDAIQHGDSKGKSSDLARWADSIQTVMKQIAPVECIVAHSFGAAAVTVASKLQLDTKKLVFISPINNISLVADNFAKNLGISLEIVKKMRIYTWNNNKKNFNKYGKDWQDILISNFHVPTLIFHDKEDKEISIEHSKQLLKIWSWAILKPTDGLGHRRILDDETVAKEMVEFIKHG